MTKPKKTELEIQQEIWYKKLKDSGFEDIEDGDRLTGSANPRRHEHFSMVRYEARADYYYLAYHFLNAHKFDTELEKTIWTYHTEGLTLVNIAKILNDAKITKTNKDKIN